MILLHVVQTPQRVSSNKRCSLQMHLQVLRLRTSFELAARLATHVSFWLGSRQIETSVHVSGLPRDSLADRNEPHAPTRRRRQQLSASIIIIIIIRTELEVGSQY